ncbi:MAG TPA: NrsF family protein [Candidatus Cybelea sp.]|nr:NrsF family protein [Candidatus Cybelea sp.]
MPATDELIAKLSDGLLPVRRLHPPAVRAAVWVLLATAVVVLLAAGRGLRGDIAAMLGEPSYLVQIAAAYLTGIAATVAAFEVSLPHHARAWSLLPAPFLALWLSGFVFGCLGHWIAIPFGAPVVADSVSCLATILAATVPLALVLWIMLRRSSPLRPTRTALLGSLGVAGFADTAHLLIHQVEASSLVLAINIVPVLVILAVGALLGRRGLATAGIT